MNYVIFRQLSGVGRVVISEHGEGIATYLLSGGDFDEKSLRSYALINGLFAVSK